MLYENIIKSIGNYINKKDTDYAILLDGVWGIGKTFFIKNIFPKKYQKDTKKEFNYIYMSAAGINDIEQFINDIYYSLTIKKLSTTKPAYANIYNNKNIIKSLINLIPFNLIPIIGDNLKQSIPDISASIVKETINFSDMVIIIDDIERISDTISIEDFLYKIYDTFILNGLKVIFVCNEKEIYSNNSEKKSNYIKIKEKVIRHTINFYRLDNSMFGKIIKSIIKDNEKYYYYKNFINNDNHIEKLINIFVEMNHLNIRTFLTYLDLSNQIFNINEIQKDNDFIENLLYKLALIIIGIVKGNEDMLDEYYIDNNYEKYSEYVNKINKLGIFISPPTIYIDIKNYIKTGYLETLNIIEDYNSIIYGRERNDFWKYYEKLQNYSIQNENDIKEAIKVVFNKIKECLNNTNEIESGYIAEYLRDFNNLKGYIDLYDENIYKKEIEEYIELVKKINDNYFYNLDLSIDGNIDKTVFNYDFYYHNNKYYKPTYKNSKMYEIDKYYENKLNNAYKKAKEIIENRLIKTFEDKKMEQYFYFNSSINRLIIYNLIMEYDFLMKLEVNAYNIDVIIKFLYINILNINNASDYFEETDKILGKVKKYLNDDKIKNGNYDNNTNKKIEELKSVVEKAEEHIKPNK